jgi:hypothetical protein
MAENITISGQLRSYDQTPIYMIKVTVYRDRHFIHHGYTNEEGRYEVSVPMGEPISVRFDTHHSLTNARDWHPSVVANVDATHDIVLNRFLFRVGTDEGGQTGFVDALTADRLLLDKSGTLRDCPRLVTTSSCPLSVSSVLG